MRDSTGCRAAASCKLIRLLRLFLIGLFLFWGVAFLFQRHLMYYPPAAPFDPASVGAVELSRLSLPGPDGVELHHWFVPPAKANLPLIVYFQGNARGLDERSVKYLPWIKKGYGVFLVGYPGYGNAGKPTEEGLYQTSRNVLDYLFAHYKDTPIVLYGESLGTGVATQMAVEYPKIAALILEAPYTSYPDAGAVRYPYLPVHLLALDRYETIRKIGQVKAPLLLIHGTADKVVPFAEGQSVFAAAREPKKSVFIEGAGHGNLYDFGAGAAVDNFLLAFRQSLH